MKTEQSKCLQCGSYLKTDDPKGHPYCLNGCVVTGRTAHNER